MATIICNNLGFFYEACNPLFTNLCCRLDSMQCTAIVGPSGSGKTTFLHLLSQWKSPSHGSLSFQRHPCDPPGLEFFRYVFSSAILINEISIEDNMFLDRSRTASSLALYQDLLSHFQLDLPHSTWPNTLSSGQQQRVGMIRALMGDALFLLADEPTSHLDPTRAHALMKTLISHLKQTQRGMICVTHDQNLLPLFDCIVNLDQNT